MHAITYLPNSKQLCDDVCQFLQGQICVLALSFSLNSSLSLFLFSLLSLSFLSCFFPLSFLSPFSLISPFSLSFSLSLALMLPLWNLSNKKAFVFNCSQSRFHVVHNFEKCQFQCSCACGHHIIEEICGTAHCERVY